ncbi:hypothetical protein SV7mr_42070 [Stieleria bergensis]|uniref:Uncharacterized protein n=1 Tax=Stieleria bergensis TaxID=2528025 RepID=A0A517SZV1_9BACT|nr:hypothetical protein SV7mr_42070 [Planctomycetes bacterium SV_7m_r]
MIHYTCDRCKRAINSLCETRFQVQIDIQPALQAELQNTGLQYTELEDVDQLACLHEQLQREVEQIELNPQAAEGIEQADALFASSKDAQQEFPGNFDLCPQCYHAFCKNPLGGESTIRLGFSNN